MATQVAGAISLKGSTEIVAEYLQYAVSSILFVRHIYPEDFFSREPKYGMSLITAQDADLKEYIGKIVQQLREWVQHNAITSVILAIMETPSLDTVERWQFDIETVNSSGAPAGEKTVKDIQQDIAAVFRQILAIDNMLPLIQHRCVFEMLVIVKKEEAVPELWKLSDERNIAGGEQVDLRSFSTSVHKVSTKVQYLSRD